MSLSSRLGKKLGCASMPDPVLKQDFRNISKFSNGACPKPEIPVLAMKGITSIKTQTFYDLTTHQNRRMSHTNTKEQVPFEDLGTRGRTPVSCDHSILYYASPSAQYANFWMSLYIFQLFLEPRGKADVICIHPGNVLSTCQTTAAVKRRNHSLIFLMINAYSAV